MVRHLRERASRNLAIFLSVALVAGLSTVFTAGRSFYASLEGWADVPAIGVKPVFPFTSFLSSKDTPKVASVPNVVYVVRALTFFGTSKDRRFWFTVSGMDESYFRHAKVRNWFPAPDDMVERWKRERTAFVVGEETARLLGIEEGHRYTFTTNGGEIEGIAVGIVKGGVNKTNMEFHYEYVDEVLGHRQGNVSMWLVGLKRVDDIQPAIAAVDEVFKNTAMPTASSDFRDHLELSTGSKRGVVRMLGIISGLILIVTLIVTINTVLFLVRERRSTIATLRVFGYSRRYVVALVVAEVMALCLAGGAFGIGFVKVLFRHGVPFGKAYLSAVAIHADAILVGVVVSVALGLIASVVPATFAARTDIVKALRST